MANFQEYLPLLQQVEGGFQKLPQDPGNYNSRKELVGTNYGISARFYESILGRPPSETDMRAISKVQAENIFREFFWEPVGGYNIKNQAIANTITDHQVNAGSGARLAQKILNNHFNYSLTVDGVIGPKTLAALNNVNPARFVTIYNEARANYYRSIGNDTFVDGWLKRLTKFAVEHQKPISLFTVATVATVGYIFFTHVFKV